MREDFNLLRDDIYTLRTEGDGLRVTKFTKDLNAVGFYHLKPSGDFYTCNCPQSNRGPCKHLDIVDSYTLYPERIDKGWFYCHQTGDWFPPLETPEGMAPPTSGGASEESPPTPSSLAVTPEVEVTSPPPSGVMIFDEPLKRRI
jgi:hypothetical protein